MTAAPVELILYGTPACHLCELAEDLLHRRGLPAPAWRSVDIAADEALLDRYGRRIPVLRRASDGAELDWPFDAATLAAFVPGQSGADVQP